MSVLFSSSGTLVSIELDESNVPCLYRITGPEDGGFEDIDHVAVLSIITNNTAPQQTYNMTFGGDIFFSLFGGIRDTVTASGLIFTPTSHSSDSDTPYKQLKDWIDDNSVLRQSMDISHNLTTDTASSGITKIDIDIEGDQDKYYLLDGRIQTSETYEKAGLAMDRFTLLFLEAE